MINKKVKDRLFAFIFGSEEHKDWILSLYNAINGTEYTDTDEIEINIMSDMIYMGMKNDVSFIIHNDISIYEQQSTYNPNMPVREMMYLSDLYAKYIKRTRQNMYGEKLMSLPVPKLVTFYNGKKDVPDKLLKLSDSFTKSDAGDKSDVEVTVHLINISHDKNNELLLACKPLKGILYVVLD